MSPGFLAAGPFGFFRMFTSRPGGGVGTRSAVGRGRTLSSGCDWAWAVGAQQRV
jgi:hypothetical protein